jgi:receptor binding protein|nr:MAG TPA: tail protein [Caudoviricetes sp.]
MAIISTGQITIVDVDDGKTQYTHLAYADDISGGGFSKTDTNKKFIGIYQDFNAYQSDDPKKYTWSKWQGSDGVNGVPGATGRDGRTPYVHFAWANNSTGTEGFTTSKNDTTRKYMGIYTDYTQTDSTNPADYTWQRVKGEDGANGVPGKPGADGRTPYVHFAYADSADGRTGFTVLGGPGNKYMGTYTDFNQPDSTDPTKYKWSLIKGSDGAKGDRGDTGPIGPTGPQGIQGLQGPKGDQGIPGQKGADGRTQYTHIAYADNASGGGFSQTDQNKSYIGMYQDFTQADSNNPSSYRWTKWKGSDGSNGIPGKPGADGKTSYIHFAYADSADGRTGFTVSGGSTKRYMGTYTDFTEADSTDPTKYKWVDVLGNVELGYRNILLNTSDMVHFHIQHGPAGDTSSIFSYDSSDDSIVINSGNQSDYKFWGVSWDTSIRSVKQGEAFSIRLPIYRDTSVQLNSSVNLILKNHANNTALFNYDLSKSKPDSWEVHNITFTATKDFDFDGFNFYIFISKSGKIKVGRPIMVRGNIVPKDWIAAPEDTEKQLNSKADQSLTQDQLNKLAERDAQLKAEMDAKAAADLVEKWINEIKNLSAVEEAGRKEAELAAIRASERIVDLQRKVGELKLMTEFVDTYMSQSEEGLIVGRKDGASKVLVSNDRISFISGGKEVASISQGVLQIDNGVFVKSLRIGRFVTIQDPTNLNRNLTMFVGGA